MDEKKRLIWDTKNNEDITSRVSEITHCSRDRVEITFNNDGRKYTYTKNRIVDLENPRTIETDVSVNGKVFLFALGKLEFAEKNGKKSYLKIFFGDNTSRVYEKYEILNTRTEKTLMEKTLEYYIEVAEQIDVINPMSPNEKKNDMVPNALRGINEINTNSPLYLFLSYCGNAWVGNTDYSPKKLPLPFDIFACINKESNTGYSEKNLPFIYPFKCNKSQIDAVNQVFSNKVSLIQGPPGTGKTQVILNVLANALLRDMRVAVVSNNNSAVKNVKEKLQADGDFDFLVAFLGNKENQGKFRNNQQEYPQWLRDWKSMDDQQNMLMECLRILEKDLKKLFNTQNELKKEEESKRELEHEEKSFLTCYPERRDSYIFDGMSLKKILSLFAQCNFFFIREKEIPFWFKVWKRFFCRIGTFAFWNRPILEILDQLKRQIYKKQILESENKIFSYKGSLGKNGFENKIDELNDLSRKCLKEKLYQKYAKGIKNGGKRQQFTNGFNTAGFQEEYPITLATSYTIQNYARQSKFDLIIVDEASQLDTCTGIVTLSCTNRIVIVGDKKQLPCVMTNDNIKKLDEINKKAKCNPVFFCRYDVKSKNAESFLDAVEKIMPGIPSITLLEHYRCNPLIIGFCNKSFYDGKLIIHTAPQSDNPNPLCIVRVNPGSHKTSKKNFRELEEVKNLKTKIQNEGKYSDEMIVCCSPYNMQADALKGSTVHKLQGREKEVIIMSTVDNDISDFVANEKLINVAVSRAKEKFFLVTSSTNQNRENCVADLINYIMYYGNGEQCVIQPRFQPVFDLMYDRAFRENFKKKKLGKIFGSPAEKVIYDRIQNVMNNHDTDGRYCFKMHIPLLEIFRKSDWKQFSPDEQRFIQDSSHVDFLIYERFGCSPVCVIEVDGYSYHKKQEQKRRDKIKDEIFKKQGLRLLRISTKDTADESETESKIEDFIFNDEELCLTCLEEDADGEEQSLFYLEEDTDDGNDPLPF